MKVNNLSLIKLCTLLSFITLCNLAGTSQTSLQLSKALYTFNDTMDVTVQGHKDLSEAYTIDLVSPFGEVVAQKRMSESTVSFPIMPMWESGFYELRVYKDYLSPILATEVVPILSSDVSDSIPLWNIHTEYIYNRTREEQGVYPIWFEELLANKDNLKGLLLSSKGKPLAKKDIIINVTLYNENHGIVWTGKTLTDQNGAFSMTVPEEDGLQYTITIRSKSNRKKMYGYMLLPQHKSGVLSENYLENCLQLAKDMRLSVNKKSINERSIYHIDMHHEAINAYFSGKRIPILGDWFIGKTDFTSTIGKGERAIGWCWQAGNSQNATFSMYPSKKFRISTGQYRVHTLNEDKAIRGTPYYLNMNTAELTGNVHSPRGPYFTNVSLAYEGAPRILISQISSLVVLTGHDNAALVPEDRAYLRPYDPIMVYFK